jgi:thymidylate synthase (FAD)
MNGTLRSWIHFCELRMGNGTQKEHREVATSAWNEIMKYFKFLVG